MLPRLLAIVLVTMGFRGCIAPTQSGDTAPQPGEVQFELAGPGGAALVVPVRINGTGPYPFVLDTGTTLTCVDEGLASELKLPPVRGTVAFGGGIHGLGRMRLLALESVQLGDAKVTELNGCSVDLSPMHKAGLHIRGLLGLNFLRGYTLTVDFPRKVVRVEPPVGGGATNTTR